MALLRGLTFNNINSIHKIVYSCVSNEVWSQIRYYAARKGTRERKNKKKVKIEVKKITLAEKIRKSKKVNIIKPEVLTIFDDVKARAEDDVYVEKYFKLKIYPFEEAIECHREILHPTIYNDSETLVRIFIELDMKGMKKTKPLESFRKIVSMKHNFNHGEERKVLVFCKEENEVKNALGLGAALVGGPDIVKLIVEGEISLHNYDTVIATPTMMPEILTIKGLLKKKHPSIKSGTLGSDIENILRIQLHGIKYFVKAFESFPEFGTTSIPIGKLNMNAKHLEENMQCAIDSVMSAKPKRFGDFITRIRIECPPLDEKLKINHSLYIKEKDNSEIKKIEDDQEDKDIAVPFTI